MAEYYPVRDVTEAALQQCSGMQGAVIATSAPRIPFTQQLIELARDLITTKKLGLAIVVSQTACEVATKLALSRAYSGRGVAAIEKPLSRMLQSKGMADDNLRLIYTGLTGKHIEKEKFWVAFQAAHKLRNRIVHSGTSAEEKEIEDAVNAAAELVAYLEQS